MLFVKRTDYVKNHVTSISHVMADKRRTHIVVERIMMSLQASATQWLEKGEFGNTILGSSI